MIYQAIENIARKIMEWAMRKQDINRCIIDELEDAYNRKGPRRLP